VNQRPRAGGTRSTDANVGVVRATWIRSGSALERARPLVLIIEARRHADARQHVDAGHAVIQPDQPVGLGVRQRIQQHALHDGEDGGVGADGERERQRGGECEYGRAQQSASGLPDFSSHACHLLTSAACATPHPSDLQVLQDQAARQDTGFVKSFVANRLTALLADLVRSDVRRRDEVFVCGTVGGRCVAVPWFSRAVVGATAAGWRLNPPRNDAVRGGKMEEWCFPLR
jgi:hypothetical protein